MPKTKPTAPIAPTAPRLTYSRAEAAAALGLDIQTIDKLISGGKLKASKLGTPGGKRERVLIRATALEAMLDATAV